MDHVRQIDLTHEKRNGVDWVRGRSGGVSTFANSTPEGTGLIWHLAKGTTFSDELYLWNDVDDHWSWEPDHDMELNHYRSLLAVVGRNFA
jgi:hypothetical protein